MWTLGRKQGDANRKCGWLKLLTRKEKLHCTSRVGNLDPALCVWQEMHCHVFSFRFLQPAMERRLAIAPADLYFGIPNTPHTAVGGLLVEARELGENSCGHRENSQPITSVVVVLIVVNCLANICNFDLFLFLIELRQTFMMPTYFAMKRNSGVILLHHCMLTPTADVPLH